MILTVTHPFDKSNKSKTSLHLARRLATTDESTLLIDFTSNAFLSYSLGVATGKPTMANVIDGDCQLDDIIIPFEKFAFAPANISLKLVDTSLAWSSKRNAHLSDALDQLKLEFDHIIIDCDSSLTFLTINSVCASDAVIFPVHSEALVKNAATSIHILGCEQLMDSQIVSVSNYEDDIFKQLLEEVTLGNKVLLLEQPIWTNEYLLPQLATIHSEGLQFLATDIKDFKLFLN